MAAEWTLPLIQVELDHLVDGGRFRLARKDLVRLFGTNDASVARISRFAQGHGCAVVFRSDSAIFCKSPPAAVSSPAS